MRKLGFRRTAGSEGRSGIHPAAVDAVSGSGAVEGIQHSIRFEAVSDDMRRWLDNAVAATLSAWLCAIALVVWWLCDQAPNPGTRSGAYAVAWWAVTIGAYGLFAFARVAKIEFDWQKAVCADRDDRDARPHPKE